MAMPIGILQQSLVGHVLTHPNLYKDSSDDARSLELNELYSTLQEEEDETEFCNFARRILAWYGFSKEYRDKIPNDQLRKLMPEATRTLIAEIEYDALTDDKGYPTGQCRGAMIDLVRIAAAMERVES